MNRLLRLARIQPSNAQRGQSLVEIAIFLPIFILIIAGIFEMGFYLNNYLNLLDSSREAVRYGADLDPSNYNPAYNRNSPGYTGSPTLDCDTTQEFYTVVACYAEENLPVAFDPSNGYDDIVISAFVIKNGVACYRFPWDDADRGWSYLGNQSSLFSTARVSALIPDDSPQQGMLILEIFYKHQQALGLPFFTMFVPREIGIYVHSIMPNPTAGSYGDLYCP
jgi:hypothetical protein